MKMNKKKKINNLFIILAVITILLISPVFGSFVPEDGDGDGFLDNVPPNDHRYDHCRDTQRGALVDDFGCSCEQKMSPDCDAPACCEDGQVCIERLGFATCVEGISVSKGESCSSERIYCEAGLECKECLYSQYTDEISNFCCPHLRCAVEGECVESGTIAGFEDGYKECVRGRWQDTQQEYEEPCRTNEMIIYNRPCQCGDEVFFEGYYSSINGTSVRNYCCDGEISSTPCEREDECSGKILTEELDSNLDLQMDENAKELTASRIQNSLDDGSLTIEKIVDYLQSALDEKIREEEEVISAVEDSQCISEVFIDENDFKFNIVKDPLTQSIPLDRLLHYEIDFDYNERYLYFKFYLDDEPVKPLLEFQPTIPGSDFYFEPIESTLTQQYTLEEAVVYENVPSDIGDDELYFKFYVRNETLEEPTWPAIEAEPDKVWYRASELSDYEIPSEYVELERRIGIKVFINETASNSLNDDFSRYKDGRSWLRNDYIPEHDGILKFEFPIETVGKELRVRAVLTENASEKINESIEREDTWVVKGEKSDVTIVECLDKNVGDTINFDGKEYLVVDDDDIEEAIEDKKMVCTSHVTDMSSLFRYENDYFDEIDIGDWDVSNVKNMRSLFQNTDAFDQNIGNWDVSNVENMGSMFRDANAFNQNIGNWDVSNVENMRSMFRNADSFDQDIGNWDVNNVEYISSLFQNAKSFNQDLSDWCFEKIEEIPASFDMGAYSWTKPGPGWGEECTSEE